MNNGSCEFESHLGHQKVVGATALATFFYPHSHGYGGWRKLCVVNRTYRTYWDFSLCFMVIVMLRDFRDFRNYLGGERRGGVVFGWIRWFGGVFCVTLW